MNKTLINSNIPINSMSSTFKTNPTSTSKKNGNLVQIIQTYVTKLISEPSGMKVLVLDKDTTSIVSCTCTQSFLLSKEVYLVDRLENKNREKMTHLKCIAFVRPTAESIALLCEELKSPKYGVYFLYFSNALKKSYIEKLAESDVFEVVKEVQEYFADYLALQSHLFSLDMQVPEYPICIDQLSTWFPFSLQRTMEGLVSVLLSLKRTPILRCSSSSLLSQRLAQSLHHFITSTEPQLFEKHPPMTLLILDRSQDIITPLLTPWTYQAMLHELLGIEKGLIDVSHIPDMNPEMKQVVMSQDDAFFLQTQYFNFGELGCSIQSYLKEFQQKAQVQSNLETLADMKHFLNAYPEFKKLSGNVSKHVMLTGELSKIVETAQLLTTSEVEQNIVCSDRDQVEAIVTLFNNPLINEDSKLKLMILYALKTKDKTSISSLLKRFQTCVSPFKVNLLDYVLNYVKGDKPETSSSTPFFTLNTSSSTSNPQHSNFNSSTSLKIDKNAILGLGKSVIKGLKGVENVYTQYTPPLLELLELHVKGKLKESMFPYVTDPSFDTLRSNNPSSSGDLLVFFIGGTTYEEARIVYQFQSTCPGIQLFLGGHTIHNSQSFLKQIHDAFTNRLKRP